MDGAAASKPTNVTFPELAVSSSQDTAVVQLSSAPPTPDLNSLNMAESIMKMTGRIGANYLTAQTLRHHREQQVQLKLAFYFVVLDETEDSPSA